MSQNRLLTILVDMLEYARPHGTNVERAFIRHYIEPLGAIVDEFNNWHVHVDDTPVLWSCHTDTVARFQDYQTIHVDKHTRTIGLSKRSRRSSYCLGADDTAGVFLCCEMIKRQVPGHYVFHYGEESGGIGSSALAKHDAAFLQQFTMAIALDRGGTADVITHQGGCRSASDVFADSLAVALNRSGLHYAPSDRGTYTDTAEYTSIVAECSNLSVGYSQAHTVNETLDTDHLFSLLTALCSLDTSTLTIARDPAVADIDDYDVWDDDQDWVDLMSRYYNRKAGDDQIPPETVSADVWDDQFDRDDYYLDPIMGRVQAELKKQARWKF